MGKRVKKRKLRRRVYFILIPLIVFLSALGFFVNLYLKAGSVISDSYEDDGRLKSDLREKEVDPKFDNVSILIMGVDGGEKRGTEGIRTDTLMVATLNKDDKTVKLLSIPRDTKVYVPEVGYETKINHAHSLNNGGTRSTIDTVENLLDIPIDYWVKVNFDAFIEVVDAIDGITVDVPYEFKEQDSYDRPNKIHLMPGLQELDGEQALALARTRKKDNDIERGKRQQEIIKAIMKKSVSVKSIFKFDDIIEAVGSNMTTNMTFDEMKSFISYGTSSNLNIEPLTLEGEDLWQSTPRRTYYWQLDDESLAETKHELQAHLELNGSQLTQHRDNAEGNASDDDMDSTDLENAADLH